MRFSRSDYYDSVGKEIETVYRNNLNSVSQTQSMKDLITSRFLDPKIGVQEYLESFRERTGLKEYLNKVTSKMSEENKKIAQDINAELGRDQNKIPESLLEIPEIKDAIDISLLKGDFSRTIDLLNKLQNLVNNDSEIPEELKNVHTDVALIDYISKKINPNDEENKTDYAGALSQTKSDLSSPVDPKSMSYFNFDGEDNKNV